MMKHLKSVLTLFIVCAIVSIALAVCYGITNPIILANQKADAMKSLLDVMPDGGDFTEVDISTYSVPAGVTAAYKSSNGGYVIQITFDGYNSGNVAMVGVSADGKVTGTKCINVADKGGKGKDSAVEIPKLDSEGYYKDSTIDTIDGVDTVGGVTVSTTAYRDAIKNAIGAAVVIGGGSYVTPEQLLINNVNGALGTEGVEFEKHFFMEVVEGVDTIYVAKNNAGHVVVIEGNFIGVVNGAVVGGVDAETNAITVSDEDKATAEAAVATIKATEFVKNLDLTGVSSSIKSVKLTNGGVYVLEINADGYGIHAPHGGSGQYIVISVAITAEGKLIGCKTVSQKETSSFGGPCANEEFYGQFVGKTQDDYSDTRTDIDMSMEEGNDSAGEDRKNYVSDIDAIAGATVTSAAYKAAIMKAYEAVKFFVGGAN